MVDYLAVMLRQSEQPTDAPARAPRAVLPSDSCGRGDISEGVQKAQA